MINLTWGIQQDWCLCCILHWLSWQCDSAFIKAAAAALPNHRGGPSPALGQGRSSPTRWLTWQQACPNWQIYWRSNFAWQGHNLCMAGTIFLQRWTHHSHQRPWRGCHNQGHRFGGWQGPCFQNSNSSLHCFCIFHQLGWRWQWTQRLLSWLRGIKVLP